MTKAEVRAEISRQRPDFQTLEKLSEAVLKKFQTLELFQTAKAVGAYMPLPDEVGVTPLFGFGSAGGVALPVRSESGDRANSPSEPQLQREKVFYIPAYDESIGGYRMARYTPELKKGRFGIPEPEHPVWAGPDELDLILVPGIAFDCTGGRLGRGRGFYDRLLPLYSALRLGICFEFQLVDAVPSEEHDIHMDALLTEKEFFDNTTNNRRLRGSEEP